jgi:hypothetical protein
VDGIVGGLLLAMFLLRIAPERAADQFDLLIDQMLRGPVAPHTTTISSAPTKVTAWPVAADTWVARALNIRRTASVAPMQ